MWLKKQVNILPSKNGRSKIGLNPKAMFNKPHLYYFNEGAVYHECQHLYITSDEEIEKGCWIYHLSRKEVFRVHHFDSSNNSKTIVTSDKDFLELPNRFIEVLVSDCKKITATTNSSLNLPQIPQQFIEKFIEEYNKGNVIKKVEVEYNEKGVIQRGRGGERTITIRKIKESWSREEVIELLHKSLDANIVFNDKFNKIFHEQLDKWIEENL